MRRRRRRIRPRTFLRELVRRLDRRRDFALNRFEFLRLGDFLREQLSTQPGDRAARFPFLDLLARAVGEVAHALGVWARAVGLAFEECRAASLPRAARGLARGLMHREHVVAVHLDAMQSVGRRAARHAWISRGVGEGHFCRVAVVFADEKRGQFPNPRHVQPFVKRAVVRRAIAEKRDADIPGLHQHRAVARARRLEDARPDDAARAHQSDLRREQMHRAAAPVRAARLASIQLREKRARIEPLRECVPVPAMRAEHRVLAPQMRAHADGDRLLPDVSMTRALNQPALVRLRQPLLALADHLHLAVKPEHVGVG